MKQSTYKIIRFRKNGNQKVVRRGLSLEDAKIWCNREDTHGKNWCEKHIPTAMRMGFTYCVEHRYAIDIVEGIKQE